MSLLYIGMVSAMPFLCPHPAKYLHSQTRGPEIQLHDDGEYETVTSTYECLACGKHDIKVKHLRTRHGVKENVRHER